jgi:hypothetical protein
MTSSAPEKMTRPRFLITIDTEGDNLWSAPREITTRNASALPRFQSLCEAYGLKPTYLTNYEMVCSPVFQEFARDALKRGTAEIGMHLHAWNSPPLQALTVDDYRHQPYLIEYPNQLIRQKVGFLTKLLEDTFNVKMTSHRAGRWSINGFYARVLVEQGYRVDCSVTPHVSWGHLKGDPAGKGGTDFSRFPEGAYRVDLSDVSRPGDSPLLELPMTIMLSEAQAVRKIGQLLSRGTPAARVWNRLFPPVLWLRPNGRNLAQMLEIIRRALHEQRGYAEFMLHSSEFMAGGSPTFRSAASIEALYRDMEQLFSTVATSFVAGTLGEYEQSCTAAW